MSTDSLSENRSPHKQAERSEAVKERSSFVVVWQKFGVFEIGDCFFEFWIFE